MGSTPSEQYNNTLYIYLGLVGLGIANTLLVKWKINWRAINEAENPNLYNTSVKDQN